MDTYDKKIFGKNYIRIKTRLFRKQMYAYIDTSEYLADRLFAEQKLAVRYKAEFEKEGTEYMVVCCIIRKKDEEKFLQALGKMEDKMLLMGHTDYMEFCKDLLGKMQNMEGT